MALNNEELTGDKKIDELLKKVREYDKEESVEKAATTSITPAPVIAETTQTPVIKAEIKPEVKATAKDLPKDAEEIDQINLTHKKHYLGEDPLTMGITKYTTWADILGEDVQWAWDKWLSSELLNMVVSYSGDGKSFLALQIAASFIDGRNFPDGTPYTGETGKILWVETEAAQRMNLERAKKMGLDLSKIVTPFADKFKDVNLDDARDRELVQEMMGLPEIKFSVIDSLSGGSNKMDENDSRFKERCFWMAECTRDNKKPILLSHHLNKPKYGTIDLITLDRVRGTSGIVQPVRIIWALSIPDREHPESKRIEQIKNNMSAFPPAFGMTIENDKAVFSSEAPSIPRRETLLDNCIDFLRETLADGAMETRVLENQATANGYSDRTLRRAKEALNVATWQQGKTRYSGLPSREGNPPWVETQTELL